MDITPKPPETKIQATSPSSSCTVIQHPRRLPGDVSGNPNHEAIVKCGSETKTIIAPYDECLAQVRKLTGDK